MLSAAADTADVPYAFSPCKSLPLKFTVVGVYVLLTRVFSCVLWPRLAFYVINLSQMSLAGYCVRFWAD